MRWFSSSRILHPYERVDFSFIRCWRYGPSTRFLTRSLTNNSKPEFPISTYKPIRPSLSVRDPSKRTVRSDISMLMSNPLLYNSKHLETRILLENEEHRIAFLNHLGNSETMDEENIEMIYVVFNNLIDIVSGFWNEAAFQFLCGIWKETFFNELNSIEPLKERLLSRRSVFTNILLNSRNYRTYESLVKPLINFASDENTSTWSDFVISTLQLQYVRDGVVSINSHGVKEFLADKGVIMADKHKFLSLFLEKGLLYTDDKDEKYIFMEKFIEFLSFLGEEEFLLVAPKYQVYKRALRLWGSSITTDNFSKEIVKLRGVFRSNSIFLIRPVYNLMSSIMDAQLPHRPNIVVEFWNYKKSQHENGTNVQDALNHRDLKSIMTAYSVKGDIEKCLKVYDSNSFLHDDSQIEVLLQISKQSKNWNHLQKQFEDMYGKGNLPHVAHYSVVMNALASIGAEKEVEELFIQLKKRGLKPTPEIYAALILCQLRSGNVNKATEHLNLFVIEAPKEDVAKSSKYLYSLIFDLHLKNSDPELLWKTLGDTLEIQERSNVFLIGSKTLTKLIDYFSSNYFVKEVDEVKNLAFRLNLTSDGFYSNLMRAYTHLDRFEQVEELAYEAHVNSPTPFKSALIYKSQLRNYRFWYRAERSKEKRLYIERRMKYIMNNLNGLVTLRSNSGLYNEIIKYHLIRMDVESAEEIMGSLRDMNLLSESHYIPIFKYHCSSDSYEGHLKVLAKYRSMAKGHLKITPRTYVYLMSSLLYLDGQKKNGFKNSHQLLQSVFDLNGLTMERFENQSTPLNEDVHKYSLELFRMVSNFVLTTADQKNNNIKILVNFLDQMKSSLEQKTSIDLKFEIIEKTAKVYLGSGNIELMEKLVENGFNEMDKITPRLKHNLVDGEPTMPKNLQKLYRRLLALKIIVSSKRKSVPQEFENILERSIKSNVRLSGVQYCTIIKAIAPIVNQKSFDMILNVCETHLVNGNWVEEKMKKQLQRLYKLTLYHLHFIKGLSISQNGLEILNTYYNVKNVDQLEQEFANVRNVSRTLENSLDKFNKEFSYQEPWSLNDVLENIPQFFLPERRISNWNKLPYWTLDIIWSSVLTYCGGDKMKAYKLMDEYPETMDLLLYNSSARYRLQNFRKQIDKIHPPAKGSKPEDLESRKRRTIEAMSLLNFNASVSSNSHYS